MSHVYHAKTHDSCVQRTFSYTAKKRIRKSFAKHRSSVAPSYLLATQVESYKDFLQSNVASDKLTDAGLHAVFKSVFPIVSYSGNAELNYVSYTLGEPLFSVRECRIRGLNYAVSLRVKLRLTIYDKDSSGNKRIKDIREQDIYIGDLPIMTDTGSFVINGIERVVVSQLHKYKLL